MDGYVRITVRLPLDTLDALRQRAAEDRTSVTRYLLHNDSREIDYEHDPFFSISKEAGDGPSNGAENHDRYI